MSQKSQKNKPWEWVTMYTYKRHWPFGYTVYFEEDTTLSWHLLEADAKSVVGMLNGAYNLGRSSVLMEIGNE